MGFEIIKKENLENFPEWTKRIIAEAKEKIAGRSREEIDAVSEKLNDAGYIKALIPGWENALKNAADAEKKEAELAEGLIFRIKEEIRTDMQKAA